MVLTAADGGPVDRLITRPNGAFVQSWTPDGSALAFTETSPRHVLTSGRFRSPVIASRFRLS